MEKPTTHTNQTDEQYLQTLGDIPTLSSTPGTSSACIAAGACANMRANSSFLAVTDAIAAATVVASCSTSYCFQGVASCPRSSIGCAVAVSFRSPAAVACATLLDGTHWKSLMPNSLSTPPSLWTCAILDAAQPQLSQRAEGEDS